MPKFKYIARDAAGKRVAQTMDAANKEEVLNNLKRENLTVVSVAEDAGGVWQEVEARQGAARGRLPFDPGRLEEVLAGLDDAVVRVAAGVVYVETRGYNQDGTVVCVFRRKVMVPKQAYGEARGGDQPGRPVPAS